eukprot:2596164-Pleurochrysis_carterae.AAC.1
MPCCCVQSASMWRDICARTKGACVALKAMQTPQLPCVSRAHSTTWPSSSPTRRRASAAGSDEMTACATREPCACLSSRTTCPRKAWSKWFCACGREASLDTT